MIGIALVYCVFSSLNSCGSGAILEFKLVSNKSGCCKNNQTMGISESPVAVTYKRHRSVCQRAGT